MKVKFIALTAVAAFTSSIATANEPIVVNQAITRRKQWRLSELGVVPCLISTLCTKGKGKRRRKR